LKASSLSFIKTVNNNLKINLKKATLDLKSCGSKIIRACSLVQKTYGTGYQEINKMRSFFSGFCGKIFISEGFLFVL
jgi:hypothetical protein